jgi:hypothetical protein
MTPNAGEIALGLALLFFLPGFAVSRALFPEWRFRGGWIRVTEILTLSLILSVALTILIGFTLGNLPGALFQASWSDPILEVILGGITIAGLAGAWVRGGLARVPPAPLRGPAAPGPDRPFELIRALDQLASQERGLRRRLRHSAATERPRLEVEIRELQRRQATLLSAREADLAQ